MGCRTVGIAGGADKAEDLSEHYRFDEAIDYKAVDLRAALKEACPDGVDVYFDNCGRRHLCGGALAPATSARGSRSAARCRSTTSSAREPTFHPGMLIVYRARMQGFLVTDYAARFGEAIPRLVRWVMSGEIRYREHVTEGLEDAPRAFIGMLNGENRGKALVKV